MVYTQFHYHKRLATNSLEIKRKVNMAQAGFSPFEPTPKRSKRDGVHGAAAEFTAAGERTDTPQVSCTFSASSARVDLWPSGCPYPIFNRTAPRDSDTSRYAQTMEVSRK